MAGHHNFYIMVMKAQLIDREFISETSLCCKKMGMDKWWGASRT
jgi:hypothetical protein